jgi:nitroimidazol reductase NimA-like FMN-containing flavoprotein (pyridoxamine 5'-phosphate oxidase superfamily)
MFIDELTAGECHRELSEADFGRLACSRANQPYVVPITVAFDCGTVYSFAMLGQKVEWMRINPLVCLEVDRIRSPSDWTSVLAFGRFEELREPDQRAELIRAHQLLQKRAMWWEPGSVASASGDSDGDGKPIFFRITVNRVTGRRAVAER